MFRRLVLKGCQFGVGLLPTALSFAGIWDRKLCYLMASSVLIVFAACLLPLFRRRANLWTFVFVSLWSVPMNAVLFSIMQENDFLSFDSGFMTVMWGLLCCCILFSVEQILFGVAAAALKNEIKKSVRRQEQSRPEQAREQAQARVRPQSRKGEGA